MTALAVIGMTVGFLTASCAPAGAQGAAGDVLSAPPASAPEAAAPSPHPYSLAGLASREWGKGPDPVVVERLGLVRGARTSVIEYESDGNRLRALLQTPDRDPPPGGFPVVLMAHGHVPPAQWTTEGSYIFPSSGYAARGFLVLKPDYRGHGKSGGTAEGIFRTIDYTIDVMELLAKIPSIPGADPSRVYLYGHSMGGEVALRVLELSDAVKAASLWAAVTEPFPENTLHYLRRRDPAQAEAAFASLRESLGPTPFAAFSPVDNLALVKEPLLVHHGTADDSVPFAWAAPFRARLDAAGVSYTFHEYPGEDHNISRSFNRVLDRDAAFFRSVP